jgi:dCMP deaminase
VNRPVVIAYIPVLHKGYMEFLRRAMEDAAALFVLGEEFIQEFMPLHQEIRSLKPCDARKLIIGFWSDRGFGRHNVKVLTKEIVAAAVIYRRVILPNEEISRSFAAKYVPAESQAEFRDVFLRWDEKSVFSQTDVHYDRISNDELDRELMQLAANEAHKSSDWWRHVGALAAVSGVVILKEHNRHVPSEHMPYIFGDPRDFVKAGERSELSTALHGEQSLIARAACEGISLKGTSIYVTTFPCPVCAKLIAYSGISKLFFASGHANLDGESVLRSQGVEIIQVV